MKKVGVTVGIIGLGVAILAVAIYYPFPSVLFHQGSAYPFPQKAVVAQPSPTGNYLAEIVHDENTKSYMFAVEGVDGTRFLLDRQFVPVVGYHDPIVGVFQDSCRLFRP